MQSPAPAPAALPSFSLVHKLWLAALALAYALFTLAQWSGAYIDFGDGNYIYIARRIAEGAVVYRDILAPQPPCHLFLGALIVKLTQLFHPAQPLYFFRGFSLLLHLLTFGLVVALARRGWGKPGVAVLAGAIFLWLPIGFWWALGYQSEPLENVFLLAMILAALRGTRTGDVVAGLFAALAGLTNATAAPFLLVLIIYTLATQPRRALRMALPCIVLVGIVTVVLQLWTSGAYLQNVVFNQVGTYPPGFMPFLEYAWGKLIGQGGKVLYREGVFLVFALVGLARLLRESPLEIRALGGLGWFCLATLGAIIYVTKGGTADYIFSLSEPAVAILAAGEIAAWAGRLRALPTHRTLACVSAAMLALFALLPGVDLYNAVWNQSQFELDEHRTDEVRYQIDRLSKPGDLILAPPFYADVADRRLLGDYSELFIWDISYWNERKSNHPGAGMKKVNELAAALRAHAAPLVLLEMDQTGSIPEIMFALKAGYVPIKLDLQNWVFATLNTRLGAFAPAMPGEDAAGAWRDFEAALSQLYGASTPGHFAMWFGRTAPVPDAAASAPLKSP